MFRYVGHAVYNQQYEAAYIPQVIPVVGPLVSIPTALVSGTMAIVKLAQAIFQKLKDGTPFLGSDDLDWELGRTPLASARDLGVIFANNVINICTLGILNNIAVCYVVSQIKCCGGDDD